MPKPPTALADPQTGLSNQQHFDILLDMAFHIADRGIAITVLYIELDGFGDFRQRNGETTSMEALRDFGSVVTSATRATDVVARIGETRIAVLLLDCNLHAGLVCADRIRGEAGPFSERTGLTISGGVASFEKGMSGPHEILQSAEATLRLALAQGGDQVAVPSDLDRER